MSAVWECTSSNLWDFEEKLADLKKCGCFALQEGGNTESQPSIAGRFRWYIPSCGAKMSHRRYWVQNHSPKDALSQDLKPRGLSDGKPWQSPRSPRTLNSSRNHRVGLSWCSWRNRAKGMNGLRTRIPSAKNAPGSRGKSS